VQPAYLTVSPLPTSAQTSAAASTEQSRVFLTLSGFENNGKVYFEPVACQAFFIFFWFSALF
jgi:hypothetical protein